MLALQDKADLHASDVMRAPRWKKVEPLAKSYIGNTIHLLGQDPPLPPSQSHNLFHLLDCNMRNTLIPIEMLARVTMGRLLITCHDTGMCV